jgi:hypothetical protein
MRPPFLNLPRLRRLAVAYGAWHKLSHVEPFPRHGRASDNHIAVACAVPDCDDGQPY